MNALIIALAASFGTCPGAVIDYDMYKNDRFGIPVQIQVSAHRALRSCRKAGLKVPATVAEYNKQQNRLTTLPEVIKTYGLTPPIER